MTHREWIARGRPDRRKRDFKDWIILAVIPAFLIIACVSTFAALRAVSVTAKIQQESVDRRDQTCLLFEREQLAATIRVIRTYQYLESLPREDYGSTLTVAIVHGLPEQEADARLAKAPGFCDETTSGGRPIGLPESPKDPRLPKHKDFSYLLKRPQP